MVSNEAQGELREWLTKLTEDMLTAEEQQALTARLREDPEARAFYRRYIAMEALLDWEYTLPLASAAERCFDPALLPSDDEAAKAKATPASRSSWFNPLRPLKAVGRYGGEALGQRTTFSLVIAAVVTTSTLLLLAVFAAPSFRVWKTQQEVVYQPPADAVARLTGMIDAAWAPGTQARMPGAPIPQDEPIVLTSGLVEIQFIKGAKVLVEGPATFIARDRNHGYLSRGKLVARVPKRASGFQLQTPQATIVDLGTEFGVEVDESGQTDVHVFQGNVLAELNGATPSDQTVSRVLVANESARFDVAQGAIDVVASSATTKRQFVRALPRQRPKPKQGVTRHMALANPSFEQPDIRKHPKYSRHTATLQMTAYGWYTGTSPLNSSDQAYYVLSTKDGTYANGQGATDGQQVVSLCLRDMREHLPDDAVPAVWMYQSLGAVDKDDVGQRLQAAVDVAVKDRTHSSPGSQFAGGGATVELAFAVGVSYQSVGDAVGNVGRRPNFLREDGIQTLDASLTIPEEMIGRELFLRIAVSEPKPNTGHGTYHVDNVRCVVEQPTNNDSVSLEGERSPK